MIEPELPSAVAELMDLWVSVPAFVRDTRLTVVAANSLARALSESFRPGVNLARFAFIDDEADGITADRDEASGQVISVLRDEAQRHRDDPDVRRLVGELASKNSYFADVWAADQRASQGSARLELQHAVVGRLSLWYQQLPVTPDGLVLVVWHAADESSRQGITRLVEVAAGD